MAEINFKITITNSGDIVIGQNRYMWYVRPNDILIKGCMICARYSGKSFELSKDNFRKYLSDSNFMMTEDSKYNGKKNTWILFVLIAMMYNYFLLTMFNKYEDQNVGNVMEIYHFSKQLQ